MAMTDYPVARKTISLSSGNLPFPGILSPCIHKGLLAHSHHLILPDNASGSSFRLELKETASLFKPDLEKAKARLSMSADDFPYGFTETQWWEYALSPHSYLALGNGVYQAGLNYFNRFLHLDIHRSEARLVDPGVGDAFLSTTNWFDEETGNLWFASWPAEDTLRRNLKPLNDVCVTIWKAPQDGKPKTRVWQGNLGDSLHQLSISPSKRFLILAELGLRPDNPNDLEQPGIAPSIVLILDLQTQQDWRLQLPSAAHVEFDPDDPDICYLSGHNIGLIGPKVCLFGPAVIQKVRLTENGPQLLESFTHPDFYRITTHIVFRGRKKNLIAASGYPGYIFLIDAVTMQIHKIIEMEASDKVDPLTFPHICRQDSYGIMASTNGQYLLIRSTGCLKIVDIESGQFVLNQIIEDEHEHSCFTGHLGQVHAVQEWAL